MAIILLLAMIGLSIACYLDMKKGREAPLTKIVRIYKQYRYLIMQLVSRDFRVKYKSSVLGRDYPKNCVNLHAGVE